MKEIICEHCGHKNEYLEVKGIDYEYFKCSACNRWFFVVSIKEKIRSLFDYYF